MLDLGVMPQLALRDCIPAVVHSTGHVPHMRIMCKERTPTSASYGYSAVNPKNISWACHASHATLNLYLRCLCAYQHPFSPPTPAFTSKLNLAMRVNPSLRGDGDDDHTPMNWINPTPSYMLIVGVWLCLVHAGLFHSRSRFNQTAAQSTGRDDTWHRCGYSASQNVGIKEGARIEQACYLQGTGWFWFQGWCV